MAADSTVELNKSLDKTKLASEGLVKAVEMPTKEVISGNSITVPVHAANTIDSMGHLIRKVKNIVAQTPTEVKVPYVVAPIP